MTFTVAWGDHLGVVDDDGTILSSDAPEQIERRLAGDYVEMGRPAIVDDVVIEGAPSKLAKGTRAHTEAALRALPGALVVSV
jgi:hypothetical protein